MYHDVLSIYVESPLVSGGGPLSDLSLCLIHGQTLANHSYVDLSLVGISDVSNGDDVQCITDLGTCCTSIEGVHRGNWYIFP